MINRQIISRDKLQQALADGVLLLTANKRQAAAVRGQYEQAQIERGMASWPTPQVMPWSAWLQKVWEAALIHLDKPLPLVLSASQEQLLWKQVIAESLKDKPLQQLNATVRRAQQAWQLVHSWQLPLDKNRYSLNSDTAAFYRWCEAFRSRCRKQNWLTTAQLPAALADPVMARALPDLIAHDRIMLLGYDRLAPLQQTLLDALITAGIPVSRVRPEAPATVRPPVKLACRDTRDEIRLMARWLRQCLAGNPQASIGIVVPDLSALREIVIQELDNILMPASLLPGNENMARPYNVSLGRPLSHYPVIGSALQILKLLHYEVSLEDASAILLSPFVSGWQEERSRRALLDRQLRESGERMCSIQTLRYHAGQQDRPYYCPVLVALLDAWSQLRTKEKAAHPGRQPAAYWPGYFAAMLKTFGWPPGPGSSAAPGRSLNSEEYQAAEAWQDLLRQFAALEIVEKTMSEAQALAQLAHMAGERVFQPQTDPLAVQVLGLLEAEEQQFDHLWVCGLHDGAWPPAPGANPFIPLPLQREHQLPQCSEEQVLEASRRAMQGLLRSAGSVLMSYPLRDGEAELGASPLLAELDAVEPHEVALWAGKDSLQCIHESGRTENVGDDPAPALNEEYERAGGGSQIFKLQAACPFRAYAEQRLGAKPFMQAEIGLNAMVRGSLMHRVLEKIWTELETQQQLLSLDRAAEAALVEAAVLLAVEEKRRFHPQTLKGRFLELEKQRLAAQAAEWLALEKQRAPFRVIEKEQRYRLVAGSISVNLFIDRIDELEDGRKVLIDYKTGSVSAAQWFGERPDEPQLPLYSMAVQGEVAAVCFGQIRAGDIRFKGVSEEEALLPGVKPWDKLTQTKFLDSWPAVLANWRLSIEQLGEAFRRGDAEVDPKRYPASCEYCDLTALCRINEQSLLDEDTGDASAAEAGDRP